MTEFSFPLPAFIREVCGALEKAGHRGYLVGGCLRDLLLGNEPHDYDLTTDATPEEMLAAFSEFRVIPTGLKHGTVTVLSGGQPVEVTTHRVDGVYRDARHPDSVSFTKKLSEDLSRRDFTVNAMAYGEETGLVDPFGGKRDLAARLLRAVGDPVARFSEDALRILRAFRFAAQLDFDIDEETLAGAAATREGLREISAERIFSELSRLLVGPAAEKGLRALAGAGCVPYVFFDVLPDETAFPLLARLPARPEVRLALLCRREPKEKTEALCRRLKTSNAFREGVLSILDAADEPLPASLYEARRFAVRHFAVWEDALALTALSGKDAANAALLCRTVIRDKSAVELRRLAVNGRELQDTVGVPAEKTAALLLYLQDLVWRDPENNRRAALFAAAKDWLKN